MCCTDCRAWTLCSIAASPSPSAFELLYVAVKYKLKALRTACMDCILRELELDSKALCGALNTLSALRLRRCFEEVVRGTVVAHDLGVKHELEGVVRQLSRDALEHLLFEAPFDDVVSAEQQWTLCVAWSRRSEKASMSWRASLKALKHRMHFAAMSGRFFVREVQPLHVLDDVELVPIMQALLQPKQASSKSKGGNHVEFDEYDANAAKVVRHGQRTQIVTKGAGAGGCQWIWFASSTGWSERAGGRHCLRVKCHGLAAHNTGNIIALIGATSEEALRRRKVWSSDECVFDLSFDEEKDEVVSMSYDWNGYVYKNDVMLCNTGHAWGVRDEVSLTLDLDNKHLKFAKNGSAVHDIEIAPPAGLV